MRTHIGMLALGDLEPGKWRELTPKEVIALSTPAPEIKLLRGNAAVCPGETERSDAGRRQESRAHGASSRSGRTAETRARPQRRRSVFV